MTKARVMVTLKSGVLDPEGKAIGGALRAMGFSEVAGVRVGKVIELTLDEGEGTADTAQRIDEMCRKLLVNPAIETYTYTLLDRAAQDAGEGEGE